MKPLLLRPCVLATVWLALLLLQSTLVASAAEKPVRRLPARTATRVGTPPYEPLDRGREHAQAWVERAEDLARTETDAVHAGDLWLSVAALLADGTVQLGTLRASEAYSQAQRAYPVRHAGHAEALVVAAQRAHHVGNVPLLGQLLDALDAFAPSWPQDASQSEIERHAWAYARVRRTAPTLRAAWHLMHGRHAEAARLFDSTAADLSIGRDRASRGILRERAARAWVAAQAPGAATRSADAAMALDPPPARSAALTFWRFLATHGALDANGSPSLRVPWPGTGFVEDALRYLLRTQHDVEARAQGLHLASLALASTKTHAALAIYDTVFGNEHLLHEARTNEAVFGGLEMAISTALDARRLEAAERWLDLLSPLARDVVVLDPLRMRLQHARLQASRDATEQAAPPPQRIDGADGGHGRVKNAPAAARMRPTAEPADARTTPGPRADIGPEAHPSTRRRLVWLGWALFVVGAVAGAARLTRRRQP